MLRQNRSPTLNNEVDMTELAYVAGQLQAAVSYLDVFGAFRGDPSQQLEHIKTTYRKLTRAVHPDKFPDATDKAVAQAAFVKLGAFRDDAEAAVASSTYGAAPVLATITTKKHTYRVTRKSGADAVCDWFEGNYDGAKAPIALSVARVPASNVLVANEARTIRLLRGVDTDTPVYSGACRIVRVQKRASKPNYQCFRTCCWAYKPGRGSRGSRW
jgi:hypothetical protein